MNDLTSSLPTKSAKIRALGKAGYTRSQIAEFLDIRYQHVRNVLVDAERARPEASSAAETLPSNLEIKSAKGPQFALRIEVGENGDVCIPPHILAAAGSGPGKSLLVRFDDDEIKLVTPEATTRKVQAAVRRLVPEGVSLVDGLLQERRREADREQGPA